MLSILAQDQDENRKLIGDFDGIDILLQQLAVSGNKYKFRLMN